MPGVVDIAFFADAGANNDSPASPMVTEESQQMLRDATELDYLTHIIIRMYENKRCASSSTVCCLSTPDLCQSCRQFSFPAA